jgi:hypothetical protein
VKILDNSPRLSTEQKAGLLTQLHRAEFQEKDLSSDMLGAGVWLIYAALALAWFRGVAWRRASAWLAAGVRTRGVTVTTARQKGRRLVGKAFDRPRAPVFEPSAAQV